MLTDVIAAFIAQGFEVFDAAVLGAHMHGLSGEIAARELSVYGVNATDVVEYLPHAFGG